MATTMAPATAVRAPTTSVPWYIWCAALAVTSAMIGGHWDISWHSSIGRDSFWTPAHMAIYLCGVLAGVAFGYLILFTTFSPSAPLAESSVHIWGFRAPLGAFIASWGGIAMLTSAPFDNWWHAAYGLDVKIVSPPHMLLFVGIFGVQIGTLALIAGHMNRSSGRVREICRWLFLYLGSIVLVLMMIILMEYTSRTFLHDSLAYILVSAITPIILAIGSRATGKRFSATFMAGWYTLFLIGFILVLPLFPAQPKLGPVYQPVTHFVPPQFPLLLIVPAFALDLFWVRTKNWSPWKMAAISAAIFVSLLLAVEWPFADFLISPMARNRFFGTMYHWYQLPPTSYLAQNRFYQAETAGQFWQGIGIAWALCAVAIRWGISRGEWFKTVRR